jgi:hypothetical protein
MNLAQRIVLILSFLVLLSMVLLMTCATLSPSFHATARSPYQLLQVFRQLSQVADYSLTLNQPAQQAVES